MAVSASLLSRLQSAQKSGTLGSIVGHEEAAAWGGKDLSSASYEDLVGAFGASDLQDPSEPGAAAPALGAPGAPAPPPAPAPMPAPMPGPGGGAPGQPGGADGGGGSAMARLQQSPAGWADISSMGGDSSMPGPRQYPRQGSALSQMFRQGRGRIY